MEHFLLDTDRSSKGRLELLAASSAQTGSDCSGPGTRKPWAGTGQLAVAVGTDTAGAVGTAEIAVVEAAELLALDTAGGCWLAGSEVWETTEEPAAACTVWLGVGRAAGRG